MSRPPLNNDYSDATSTSAGVYGGYVLALKFNVDFSDAGDLNGSAGIPFGDLILADTIYPLFNGLTVRQYLNDANRFLGGDPPPYTFGAPGIADVWEWLDTAEFA